MKILYPYNELLPTKKAHDVFIFQECSALKEAKLDVTLLCGKGSLTKEKLFEHYAPAVTFDIQKRFTLRKNLFLNLSWNLPFFHLTQSWIASQKPHAVILSVFKQGLYHLKRKVAAVTYIYEVHELKYYPGYPITDEVHAEKEMLQKADAIVVTTNALKDILERPPYNLKNPIHVVALAVTAHPLQKKQTPSLELAYVGQLYEGQGIELLLEAFQKTTLPTLKIIGGSASDIERLKKKADPRVQFLGFQQPHALRDLVKESTAFVAPFEAKGRMAYVAHTKLCEYYNWARPVIVPDLPLVHEHFPHQSGALFFKPGDSASLASSLELLQDSETLERLNKESENRAPAFSWSARAQAYRRLLTG